MPALSRRLHTRRRGRAPCRDQSLSNDSGTRCTLTSPDPRMDDERSCAPRFGPQRLTEFDARRRRGIAIVPTESPLDCHTLETASGSQLTHDLRGDDTVCAQPVFRSIAAPPAVHHAVGGEATREGSTRADGAESETTAHYNGPADERSEPTAFVIRPPAHRDAARADAAAVIRTGAQRGQCDPCDGRHRTRTTGLSVDTAVGSRRQDA